MKVALIAFFSVLAGCASHPIADDNLRQRGFDPESYFVVVSPSMSPAIAAGDRVYIDRTPYAQLKIGDIVLFHPNGVACGNSDVVCHRIVARGPWSDSWVTKGDNAEHADFP